MKSPLLAFFLLLSATARAELAPELKTFLGPPPPKFQQHFRAPAKQLRKALLDFNGGHEGKSLAEFNALTKGPFEEHALYYAGRAARVTKQLAKSTESFLRLRREFPSSPYDDEAAELLTENTCDLGLQEAKTKPGEAATLLRRCLDATPWKNWNEREPQATALYEILKKSQDPIFGNYVAEIIQALPASSGLRTRLQKEIKNAELEGYASVPRFRNRSPVPPGVKAVFPDQNLFDEGMQAVLEGKWGSARTSFLQLDKDFPISEHRERALYWVARSYEATGDEAEANRRFEEIFRDNPLTYYGLQAALHLKKDLTPYLAPSKFVAHPFEGTPVPRQAMSLWRLRALLEEGLLEPARSEAKELFLSKPGGSTFGQDNANGAALTALLYDAAGYSNGAFANAYAAVSLDPGVLNSALLRMIFPAQFEKAFATASAASGVNPLLLYSVAKQESAFLPNAVSRANAFGLMQLLLVTAREMDPRLNRDDLFQPGPNTMAGSRYLGKLIDRFGGSIPLALAGYNAGPNRAQAWQRRLLESDSMRKKFDVDVFIDTIPFTETRKYVGSILRNYAWYKLLRKEKIESMQELATQWQNSRKESPSKELPPGTLPPGIAAPPANPPLPQNPQAPEPQPVESNPPAAPAPSPEPVPQPTAATQERTSTPNSAATGPASPNSPGASAPPANPTTPENPESSPASPR